MRAEARRPPAMTGEKQQPGLVGGASRMEQHGSSPILRLILLCKGLVLERGQSDVVVELNMKTNSSDK